MIMSYNDHDDDEDEEKEEKKNDEITWIRKSKWNEIFGVDFGKDFEMPDLEEIIKQIMKQFRFPNDKSSKGPIVWGFSMSMGPNKKPKIRQFGRLNPRNKKKKLIEAKREPLIDVIKGNEEITVIAEILGVDESDIKVKASETELKISIDTSELKYYQEIALPSDVVPKSAKVHYKNGILEVKLERKRT